MLLKSTKIKKSNFYTPQFWLLCGSNFLFSASFSMMLPELPAYLTGLGGKAYIGLIISLFTLTAGVSRPFSGKLSDTVGRVPVMFVGSLVCVVCGVLYPWMLGVAGFLFLRLLHGFSTGFKPTATAAYVADVVPDDRRGEALGVLAIAASVGMSAGPPAGSWLTLVSGINTMFYVSSGLALLSVVILLSLKETLSTTQKFSWKLLVLRRDEILEPKVLAPTLVMLSVSYATGMLLTIIPLFCVEIGIENKGLFFGVYTASSLLVRLVAAKTSDTHGRVAVLRMSVLVMLISITTMAFVSSAVGLLSAAFVFGLAWGLNGPTLHAWTIDRSVPAYRGRAVATTYMGLEAGICIGAAVSGLLMYFIPNSFRLNFLLCSGMTALALGYLFYVKRDTPPA